MAEKIRSGLKEKGYPFAIGSPTNQIFILMKKEDVERIQDRVELTHWDDPDEAHSIMRICTGWATTEEDVKKLLMIL